SLKADPYAGPPPPKREESFSRGPRSGGYGSERSSYGFWTFWFIRPYFGNLSWGVDDTALESLFGEQGNVVEARVIYDSDTGRSKGFGIWMEDKLESRKLSLGHQGANCERLCILQILEV
ncbi:hypothetical protein HID58_014371, partial [Brassica napus]